MDERQCRSGPQHGRQRRPHRLGGCGGIGVGETSDGPVRPRDRVGEEAEQLPGWDGGGLQPRHGVDGGGTGRGTEAVGDGENGRTGVHRILVARADEAPVRQRGMPQRQQGVRGVGGGYDRGRGWGRGRGGVRVCVVGHVDSPSRKVLDEDGGHIAAVGGVGLGLGPERAHLAGRGGPVEVADPPDARERHPQPAQPGHQPGLFELLRGVAAVARHRVDLLRTE